MELIREYPMPVVAMLVVTVVGSLLAGANDWSVAAIYGILVAAIVVYFAALTWAETRDAKD